MAETPGTSAAGWSRRGQELEAQNSSSSLLEAVRSYEQAIACLHSLPPASESARRDLAVAWMNRGNALQKLGRPENFNEAVRSYDETITLLRDPLSGNDPSWHNTLGAAWMNRGLALHRLAGEQNLAAAVHSHEAAVSTLQVLPLEENIWFRLNLAAAEMNLANAWLDAASLPDRFIQARAHATRARALLSVESVERENPLAADLGLKARRAQCDALGQLLALNHPGLTFADLATEASDTVDEGLALVRHWEQRGLTHFRPLALRLFYFGAQVYRIHQPHFLAEFLLENIDPERSPGAITGASEFHQIAGGALATVLQTLRGPQFVSLEKPADVRRLETWQDLRAAQARLEQLRVAYLQTPENNRIEAKPSTSPAPAQLAT